MQSERIADPGRPMGNLCQVKHGGAQQRSAHAQLNGAA